MSKWDIECPKCKKKLDLMEKDYSALGFGHRRATEDLFVTFPCKCGAFLILGEFEPFDEIKIAKFDPDPTSKDELVQ